MHFPVILRLGPWAVPAHLVFETLAYTVGFQLYRLQRRVAGDRVDGLDRLWVIAGAIVGAATGAKVLCWFVEPAVTLAHLDAGFLLFGGKTIVGGLAGGLVGVELVKKWRGVTRSTGDLFAVPLAIGTAIGRIGCFLQGLPDRTYGLPTSLPWGVDFGDGIARHPTQLYEALFMVGLATWLYWRGRKPYAEGALFRQFMASYMAFRLAVEFIKPGVPLGGLTAIQWTCLAVLTWYGAARFRSAAAPDPGLVGQASAAP